MRLRESARRRGRRALLLALVIGVAAGVVVGVGAGARRIASAPDRYTRALGGEPDLLLYQTVGPPLTDAVRTLPGVADAKGATFIAAFPATERFDEVVAVTSPFSGSAAALGAVVVEGREADPRAPGEFVANRPWVELVGAEVGDRFEIQAYDAAQLNDQDLDLGVIPAIAPFPSTLVGITESAGDLENPLPTIVHSPAMLTAYPDIGIVASFVLVDTAPGIHPDDVAVAARSLPGGEVLQRTPDAQYVSADVRRAVQFVSVSLWIVAAVAGGALALVIGLLTTQLVGPRQQDRLALRALGWHRGDFALAAFLEAAATATVAVAAATSVAVTVSGLFPFGTVRILEPHPGIEADAVVLATGAVAIFAAWVIPAIVNERWPRRERGPRSTRAVGSRVVRPLPPLSASLGVRYALEAPPGRRSPWFALAAGIIGCAGCCAAITVGLSIGRLIDEPAQRGVDVDDIYGNQYLPQLEDIVTPARADPDVGDLAAATIGTLSIDGLEVSVLAFETVKGSLDPTILEGRAPRASTEIALGREILRHLDKDLGETVETMGPLGTQRELAIVGVVMTPDQAGGGAAVTYETYTVLVPDATRNLLLVRFADDAAADAVGRLADATGTSPGSDLLTLPTSVGAVRRVLPLPYLLAAILASLGAVALMQTLATSVADRRRDLAILHALGAVRRQLRGLLHWQATTVAAVVLALGVPIGLLAGRMVFGAIAERIGVLPDPLIAWARLPLLVVAVVAITNIAAVAPGTRAIQGVSPRGDAMTGYHPMPRRRR